MNKIFLKSSEKMDELKDNEVDLIITSPPYWNAIDYDVHTEDNTKWFRTRKGGEYEKYLDWLMRCFQECYRVLKPGKFTCVVIGTLLYNGKHYPLPQHFVSLMDNIGYEFHQDIVWYKVTGGVRRAGVTIQNPYPGYYCPNIMTEYILIFKKHGLKIYQNRTKEEKEKNKIPIDDLFTKELANNIWHIAPVPPNQYDHPCPFPEEIPYRLIKLFSYPDDLILDPFLGIGTTTKVANCLNRKWVGYEIKEKYIKISQMRLKEPLFLRDQLISIFEKLPISEKNIKIRSKKYPKKYFSETTQSEIFDFIIQEKKDGYRTKSKKK